MKKRTELTEAKFRDLDYKDFIAITLAEAGAMGDPKAIEIVDKNLNFYYTHFGNINDKLLEDKLLFLKTVKLGFGEIKNLENDWSGLYTGAGNYLFVRPEYAKPILEYIENNYKEIKKPDTIKLYIYWREALENIAKAKNG